MHGTNKPTSRQAQGFTLHYAGSAVALATVVADEQWPVMFRVLWPDRTISDMANLSRACDGAEVIAERGPPRRKATLLRWRPIALSREALRRPLARQPGEPHKPDTPASNFGGAA